ncbi:MAG: hypothetical protein V4628_05320 [Pseudomonadota bacterium]
MKPKSLSCLIPAILGMQFALLASCDQTADVPPPVIETPVVVTPEVVTPVVDTPPVEISGNETALKVFADMATPDQIKAINYFNSLVVVDPAAIRATSDVFSFDLLMTSLAQQGGSQVADLDKSWIDSMTNPQTVNEDTAEPRIDAAEALTAALADKAARIQLIAVTNRMDLTKIDSTTHSVDRLGETHLVYELRDAQNNPLPYTVIMEFGFPLAAGDTREAALKRWAERWSSLSTRALDSDEYRQELLALLTEIATRDNFLQMRTNESVDASLKWELRQFSLQGDTFKVDVLPQTPSERYKETDNLVFLNTYIQDHSTAFLDGDYDFSSSPDGAKMLGMRALGGSTWKQNNSPSDAYYIFYANTCTGCHLEVNKGGDRHVFTNADAKTVMSPFLTEAIMIDAKLSKSCVPRGAFSWCVQGDPGTNQWIWNESLRRRSLLACFAAGFTSCRIADNNLVEESALDTGAVIRIDGKPYH